MRRLLQLRVRCRWEPDWRRQSTGNAALHLTAPGRDSDITIYGWDNRGRLTLVTHYASFGGTADLQVTYGYDAFDRWVGETITQNGTTTQTRFVYDGNQIVLQFDGAAAASGEAGQSAGLPERIGPEPSLPLGSGGGPDRGRRAALSGDWGGATSFRRRAAWFGR